LAFTDDNRPFLRSFWSGYLGLSYHKYLIWGSPTLTSILKLNDLILIDGTFRVVPSPFHQLLIIMAYDKMSTLFVPVFLYPYYWENRSSV